MNTTQTKNCILYNFTRLARFCVVQVEDLNSDTRLQLWDYTYDSMHNFNRTLHPQV